MLTIKGSSCACVAVAPVAMPKTASGASIRRHDEVKKRDDMSFLPNSPHGYG